MTTNFKLKSGFPGPVTGIRSESEVRSTVPGRRPPTGSGAGQLELESGGRGARVTVSCVTRSRHDTERAVDKFRRPGPPSPASGEGGGHAASAAAPTRTPVRRHAAGHLPLLRLGDRRPRRLTQCGMLWRCEASSESEFRRQPGSEAESGRRLTAAGRLHLAAVEVRRSPGGRRTRGGNGGRLRYGGCGGRSPARPQPGATARQTRRPPPPRPQSSSGLA
jgi:hypothetical protein